MKDEAGWSLDDSVLQGAWVVTCVMGGIFFALDKHILLNTVLCAIFGRRGLASGLDLELIIATELVRWKETFRKLG